jgi:hypothetical protein
VAAENNDAYPLRLRRDQFRFGGAELGMRRIMMVDKRATLYRFGQRQLQQGLALHALSRSLTSQGATAQLVARNKVAQGVLGAQVASTVDLHGALPSPRTVALRSIAQQRVAQGLAAQELARRLVNRGRAYQLLAQKKLTRAMAAHSAIPRTVKPNVSGTDRFLYAKAAGLF